MGLEVDLVKTGIEGLDELIGGGFIKGRTYLVAGETGTGKTIFALNYLLYGALNGEPGVYLLVDEEYENFMAGAKSFGWDLEVLVKRGLLSIVTLLPDFVERVKSKPVETIVNSIVESLRDEAERIGAKRLVIDPIAPLVVGEESVARMREYVRSLLTLLERRLGTTAIVTSEVPTGTLRLSRFGVEEFLASGVIVLTLRRLGNRFVRALWVRKMRWRPAEPAMYQFDIVPGKGIVVYKDKRLA
ncbi:MAG TPA: recombinase RecA [Thermofilaceae archaeon]|nr:recombinase RecA [Thermofilaceae archaeon]